MNLSFNTGPLVELARHSESLRLPQESLQSQAAPGQPLTTAINCLWKAGHLDAGLGVSLPVLGKTVSRMRDSRMMVFWLASGGRTGVDGSFLRLHAAMGQVGRGDAFGTFAPFDALQPVTLRPAGRNHSRDARLTDLLTILGQPQWRAPAPLIVDALREIEALEEQRYDYARTRTWSESRKGVVAVLPLPGREQEPTPTDVFLTRRDDYKGGTAVFHLSAGDCQAWLRELPNTRRFNRIAGEGGFLTALRRTGFNTAAAGLSDRHAVIQNVSTDVVLAGVREFTEFLWQGTAA